MPGIVLNTFFACSVNFVKKKYISKNIVAIVGDFLFSLC